MSKADDPLAALRARFLIRCAADLKAIQAAVDEPGLRLEPAFRSVVHRLTGTAGTFGFWEISRLAAPVDDALHESVTPEADQLTELAQALEAILTPS